METPTSDLHTEAADGNEGYGHTARSGIAPDTVTAASPESSQCGMCHRVRHALRCWWKVALFVGVLLGAVAAACVWWSYVPLYTAEAKLQLKEQRPYIAFDRPDNSEAFVRTQLQLFRTRVSCPRRWKPSQRKCRKSTRWTTRSPGSRKAFAPGDCGIGTGERGVFRSRSGDGRKGLGRSREIVSAIPS